MKNKYLYIMCIISIILSSCGKVGPLNLPEEKLDKSLISYPCDEDCQKRFAEEKERQQSIILQTD
tara:strand:+ start:101 stop:295 length:195 start_codon:yes stop_codon:yes gene_type:complete